MPYCIALLLYCLFVGLSFCIEEYRRTNGMYGYCFNHRILIRDRFLLTHD